MPGKNYKSVSLNEELVTRTKQLIEQIGTYHSVSEFVSEAVRLRIETLEKTTKNQEATQPHQPPTDRRKTRTATSKPKPTPGGA